MTYWKCLFWFHLRGTPRTKGSMTPIKAGGKVILREPRDSIEWQERISRTAMRKLDGMEPHTGPVAIMVICIFDRPKGHFGTGKNAGVIRESAPEYPTPKNRFDVDKLARPVLDALTGLAYEDDSQVVWLEVHKKYTDEDDRHPGLRCRVEVLSNEPPGA